MSAHPWLAPDGRPWFARRRGRRVFVAGLRDGEFDLARRTRVAVVVSHFCASRRAGPLGKAALWGLGWAPWEF